MNTLDATGNLEQYLYQASIKEPFIVPAEREKCLKATIELLTHQLSKAEKDLYFHKLYNQPWNPLGSSFTEMLHAAMYGTRCCGSGGAGWDTVDMGESKFSNRLQSRTCKCCKVKVMFFLARCPECGSTDLSKPDNDSRWGLVAKTHLTYLDKAIGYRLAIFEPTTNEPTCKEFILRSFFIPTKDPYLTRYAKEQFKRGGKNINFMPLGQDFYRSAPCLHLKATITMDSVTIDYFDTTNTTPEIVPDKFNQMTDDEIFESKTMGKNGEKRGRK